MEQVSSRTHRRVDTMLIRSPSSINSIIFFDWSTNFERAIMHFCRMYLMKYYPEKSSSEAKRDNHIVARYAKQNGIRRSEARKLLAGYKAA